MHKLFKGKHAINNNFPAKTQWKKKDLKQKEKVRCQLEGEGKNPHRLSQEQQEAAVIVLVQHRPFWPSKASETNILQIPRDLKYL